MDRHLHRPIFGLVSLLATAEVLIYPVVVGEIAMGSPKDRERVLRSFMSTFSDWADLVRVYLQRLPHSQKARDPKVLSFIEAEALHGLGIGYVDVHLLASARLVRDTRLWTRDKRLAPVAAGLGLSYSPRL